MVPASSACLASTIPFQSTRRRRRVPELPRPMREALVLRFYAGFTEPEISVALRVPIGTVKSRLNRARRRLAEALGPAIEEERT